MDFRDVLKYLSCSDLPIDATKDRFTIDVDPYRVISFADGAEVARLNVYGSFGLIASSIVGLQPVVIAGHIDFTITVLKHKGA